MDEQTELLREMRDLLRLIAEPAIAKRDQTLRAALLQIVGRGKKQAKAVLLMNGSRSQSEISKQSGMDSGNLSRLEKSLRVNGLLKDSKRAHLTISIPDNFFETVEGEDD